MKILVTGGNGFLGTWIIKALLSKGHHVRVLHRSHSDMSSLKGLTYESALGDVTDLDSLIKATQGVQAVFNVAAVISYNPKDQKLMEKVNVGGTQNVVEACLKNKVARLVHTSSVVAIGARYDRELLNEESPFDYRITPMGYYITKYQAELVIKKAVKDQKLDAVIVNPSIMFGAGDAVKGSRSTHMKVASGKFPFYPSGGVNVMHVADAVDGHLSALERGRTGERYILGGENILIKELFEKLAAAGGQKAPLIPIPAKILQTAFKVTQLLNHLPIKLPLESDAAYIATLFHWYDMEKAKRELGLKPRSATHAINESVHWARNNGYLNAKA